VHYYSVLCLLPYFVFEASQWRRGRVPSAKLNAGILGVLCGAVLLSPQILGARSVSRGFWAPPSISALWRMYGEFMPFGLFIGAAVLIWIAWMDRQESVVIAPMLPGERLGWYFLTIPMGGYIFAKVVTNAFYFRYFIGMLAGVAVAFACVLCRSFR